MEPEMTAKERRVLPTAVALRPGHCSTTSWGERIPHQHAVFSTPCLHTHAASAEEFLDPVAILTHDGELCLN